MKKGLIFGAVIVALATCFASCNTESYRHQVAVVYPEGNIGYIYADQTVDSISFLTFDTYRYSAYQNNPDNFISINENYATKKINNQYYAGYYFTLPVYFQPNTTDTVRIGYVLVDSKSEMDDWNGTAYATYLQVNWHCISVPSPRYQYSASNDYVVSCEHIMQDSCYQVTDTIQFKAFDKWTLTTSNEDIVKPQITQGEAGWNKVPCTVGANSTNDTIRTSLLLQTDNGAKTTIKFEHAPKIKKD